MVGAVAGGGDETRSRAKGRVALVSSQLPRRVASLSRVPPALSVGVDEAVLECAEAALRAPMEGRRLAAADGGAPVRLAKTLARRPPVSLSMLPWRSHPLTLARRPPEKVLPGGPVMRTSTKAAMLEALPNVLLLPLALPPMLPPPLLLRVRVEAPLLGAWPEVTMRTVGG